MARLSDWLQSATELATSTEGHRAGPPMRAGGDRRGSALARALRRAEKLESKTRSRQSELNRAQKHAAPAEKGAPASARLFGSGTSLGAAHDGRAGRAPSPCPWPATTRSWNAQLLPALRGGPTTRHRRRLEQRAKLAPPNPEAHCI